MSIRVKHKVVVQTSLDTDTKRKLFYQDDDTTAEVVITAFDQQAGGTLSVAAAASENLPFGDVVDVRGVYLELSGDCSVYINGSPDAIPVKTSSSTEVAKLFLEADINQVTITNTGSTTLTGQFCVWGDPSA